MKLFATLLAIFMSLALVNSQSPFSGLFQFNPLGAPGPLLHNAQRDPRQNRGPVLFPDTPADPRDMTSGVIVGASGYGFVDPGQQRFLYG